MTQSLTTVLRRASLPALLCVLAAGPAMAQAPAAEAKPEATAPAAPAAAPANPAAPAAPAKAEDSMPEDCTKLIGAIVACRTAGGWKQMICEKGAAMQFNKCPIAVDKLPIKL